MLQGSSKIFHVFHRFKFSFKTLTLFVANNQANTFCTINIALIYCPLI